MYRTCLFCNDDLGENEIIDQFPVGRKFAFDQALGRLWVICTHCGKWNLTPLDERWEAIEDCERKFRNTTARFSTANVGMALIADHIQLVRIGKPLLPEFASWRYGNLFGRRMEKNWMTPGVRTAIGGTLALSGFAIGWVPGGTLAAAWGIGNLVRNAMKREEIIARLKTADGQIIAVQAKHLRKIWLNPEPGLDRWSLHVPHHAGVAVLEDWRGIRATAQLMSSINRAGAPQRQVDRAVDRLEDTEHPLLYLGRAALVGKEQRRLDEEHRLIPGFGLARVGTLPYLPAPTRLALEMAANEEAERRALEGALEELEAAWREAEEIAQIADNMFVEPEIQEFIERNRLQRGSARHEVGSTE